MEELVLKHQELYRKYQKQDRFKGHFDIACEMYKNLQEIKKLGEAGEVVAEIFIKCLEIEFNKHDVYIMDIKEKIEND